MKLEKGKFFSEPHEYRKKFYEGVNSALKKSGEEFKQMLIEATPIGATGVLRKNWSMSIGRTGVSSLIEIEIENITDYIDPVEYGRKPAPFGAAGIRALRLWVKKKLKIGNPVKAEKVAWAIAQSKKKKPTPGQNFVKKTMEEGMPEVIDRILQPGIQKAIKELQ